MPNRVTEYLKNLKNLTQEARQLDRNKRGYKRKLQEVLRLLDSYNRRLESMGATRIVRLMVSAPIKETNGITYMRDGAIYYADVSPEEATELCQHEHPDAEILGVQVVATKKVLHQW